MINYLESTNLSSLKELLKKNNNKRILVISGKKSYYKSGANKIFFNLFKKFKHLNFYFKRSYFPEISELIKIIRRIKIFQPDIIISIGGGSVIDYAKIANTLYDCRNIKNLIIKSKYNIKNKYCSLIAIPTTAGSGAEVTSNAVIYIDKKKYSIENEALIPNYFYFIPELIKNSSKKIKASSGFDAMAQSLESIISLKSNSTSIKYASKSLEYSLNNYLNFIKKPNIKNTYNMCISANLSGKATSISKTTEPHAVSYPFTAHFGVSHGHAVSLTLNEFLKFNFFNMDNINVNFNLKKRYELIFKIFKVKNIFEFDKKLENLKKEAKLEQNFTKLGINIAENYSKILSGVNTLRLKNNPINLDRSIIKKILLEK